jgi:hypothetical protein
VDWKTDYTLTRGVWTHIAFVVNDAGTKATFYVNGSAVEEKIASFDAVVPQGPTLFCGDYREGNTQAFKGELGMAEIWSSELSAGEIMERAVQQQAIAGFEDSADVEAPPEYAYTYEYDYDYGPKPGTTEQVPAQELLQEE